MTASTEKAKGPGTPKSKGHSLLLGSANKEKSPHSKGYTNSSKLHADDGELFCHEPEHKLHLTVHRPFNGCLDATVIATIEA